MPKLPNSWSHFVFGALQSALTSGVASAIASFPRWAESDFFRSWLIAWSLAWLAMLPLVVVAAPVIRRITTLLTEQRRPEIPNSPG